MNQLPSIRLNAPFTVQKATKVRAWRLMTAVVALAFVGQTTMMIRALPGMLAGASDRSETGSFKVDLKQWADESPMKWQHGDLNRNNSAYQEGETVPFRLALSELEPGADYVLRVRYDFEKKDQQAYDYLTGYNVSRSPAPVPAGAPTIAAIPTDSNLGFTQTAGNFSLWGAGFLGEISGPTTDGHEKYYQFTIRASQSEATLLWGGHLASADQWGQGLGAGSISGAPFHVAISRVVGDRETSSQDRSIQLDEVTPDDEDDCDQPDEDECDDEDENLGSIKLKKIVDVGNASADAFSFTIQPDPNQVGTVHTTNGHYTFDNLPAGTYAINELPYQGYRQVSSTCAAVVVEVDDEDQDESDNDVNSASLSTTNSAGQDDEDESSQARCVIRNAQDEVSNPVYDIDLEKTGLATVAAGGNLTYTLEWEVDGDTAVTNAVITDPIPANTSFVSASNDGTETAGVVTWNLGTKQPGDHGTVTLLVTVNSPLANGTIITNNACFDTTETSAVCDDATTAVASGPVLIIDKGAASSVTAGGNLDYVLNWAVSGNAAATNVVISDSIPANTSFVSADNGGTLSNGVVTWNLGSKNPGEHGTVGMTVKVNSPIANGTVVTNTGCIDSEQTEIVCDTTATTVQSAPSLSISKINSIVTFANPGQSVTYTVIVTNAATATDTAHAVNLVDVLPTGFTYSVGGGSTKTFSLGEIAPGASVTTMYVVAISAAQTTGTYTNTATAQGSNTTSVNATSNVEVRVPQTLGVTAEPDLKLTKKASPTITNPGKTVTYSLTITNISDVTADNLVIKDTLPAGFTMADTGKNSASWKIPTLAAGASVTIPYDVVVGKNVKAGTYKNVAVLTADDITQKKAQANVEVRLPQVAGLATTGVGPIDYAFFSSGLLLIGAGATWFRRLRRPS